MLHQAVVQKPMVHLEYSDQVEAAEVATELGLHAVESGVTPTTVSFGYDINLKGE
jgi:hypothetical protein